MFLGMDQALIFSARLDIWMSYQNQLIENDISDCTIIEIEIDLIAHQSYASEQLQNLEYLKEPII